jgi:hypothetical protein
VDGTGGKTRVWRLSRESPDTLKSSTGGNKANGDGGGACRNNGTMEWWNDPSGIMRAADPFCKTEPISRPGALDCGVQSKRRMCETKPNLGGMGYLGKRALRAERFGEMAESAKQSQYRSEVSSLKCEVSSSVPPPGVIPAGGGWATWRLTARAKRGQFRDQGPCECGVKAECVKQSQTWIGWGTWERRRCVQSGSAAWRSLQNKANWRRRGRDVASRRRKILRLYRRAMPLVRPRAILQNKANWRSKFEV